MFMHYYLKYSYDPGLSFEDYFTQDLINMFSIKGIFFQNLNDFKIFAYTFFSDMVREINKHSYKDIKKSFHYYSDLPLLKKDNSITSFKDYINLIRSMNIQTAVEKCLKPLIATKERIVEMMVEVAKSKSENRVGSSSSEVNSNLTIRSNDEMSLKLKPDLVSKRVVGQLSQDGFNESEQDFTNGIAIKIDGLIDILLAQGTHKTFNIRNFLCYIVEINSDLIRLFPEYEDIPDTINLRVIIGARNLYLVALEVYYSICDLYDINLNTIMQVFKNRYPFSYNEDIDTPIRVFYKTLINQIIESKGAKSQEEIMIQTISLLEVEWEEEINKKGKELTYYSKA